MGKLETIDRIAYMNDMRILYERILSLESKMDYVMDRISKFDVEQLQDIRLKPTTETTETTETKKKTNKKVK